MAQSVRRFVQAAAWFVLLSSVGFGYQGFQDRTHFSKVFGEPRTYRILFPPGYETSGKAYPVIYYFHGHSDRYTLERYDNGTDTIPKMLDYVARNDVIVVSVDGYVAKDYTGFYGGAPWDVFLKGGDMDFGLYFQELVSHIDSTYRTLTDRRHRGTSGSEHGRLHEPLPERPFSATRSAARRPSIPGRNSMRETLAVACSGARRITSHHTATPWCGSSAPAATTSASITRR